MIQTTTKLLRVEIKTVSNYCSRLTIKGSIEYEGIETLYGMFTTITKTYKSRFIVIDANGLERISTIGVALFTAQTLTLKQRGGKLIFVGMDENLRKQLVLPGFTGYFLFFSQKREAEEYLQIYKPQMAGVIFQPGDERKN